MNKSERDVLYNECKAALDDVKAAEVALASIHRQQARFGVRLGCVVGCDPDSQEIRELRGELLRTLCEEDQAEARLEAARELGIKLGQQLYPTDE